MNLSIVNCVLNDILICVMYAWTLGAENSSCKMMAILAAQVEEFQIVCRVHAAALLTVSVLIIAALAYGMPSNVR